MGKKRTRKAFPITERCPSAVGSKGKLGNAQLISEYHAILKRIAQSHSEEERKALNDELRRLGGTESYQRASLYGTHRSSDTSRWLLPRLKKQRKCKLKLLDVGALELVYREHHEWIQAHSIDLYPRRAGIEQADFLEYYQSEPFDVICLSLVLNYCGDAVLRGRMLRRAHELLSSDGLLYLVLPKACVQHSRRMTVEYLQSLMGQVGFTRLEDHCSTKLYYSLWRKSDDKFVVDVVKWNTAKSGYNNFTIKLE